MAASGECIRLHARRSLKQSALLEQMIITARCAARPDASSGSKPVAFLETVSDRDEEGLLKRRGCGRDGGVQRGLQDECFNRPGRR